MKLRILFILLAIGVISCTDQGGEVDKKEEIDTKQLDVDRQYRPLLHLFTSTGCGGCGRFGIPVFSDVAVSMGDSILALPTHFKYDDKYITPSSLAIEKGVVEHYSSPQIWVNANEITYDIIRYSKEVAKEKTKVFLRSEMNNQAEAFVGIDAKLKSNGRFDIDLAVLRNVETTEHFYYEVYGMEDGPIGSQAGADPFVATHNRVNRGGHFGDIGKKLESEPNETMHENFEFIPCVDCAQENMYFYVIVWKEISPGRYAYVNGMMHKPN